MTEKLLTYALGRGVESYDAPAVRAIVRDAAPADYRFSSLVLGIVQERAVSDEETAAMIITKMALPRRTFLRGVGADAGAAAARRDGAGALGMGTRAAQPVRARRLLLPAERRGDEPHRHQYWKPTGDGADFELSPILTPLAPYRDQMVVVSGLSHPSAEALGDGAGDHSRGTCTWLTGVHPKHTEGADIRNGTSVDQVIASRARASRPRCRRSSWRSISTTSSATARTATAART